MKRMWNAERMNEWMNETAAQPLQITKMALKANDVHFMRKTLAYSSDANCKHTHTAHTHSQLTSNSWSGSNKNRSTISMTFDKIEMEIHMVPCTHPTKSLRKNSKQITSEWNRALNVMSTKETKIACEPKRGSKQSIRLEFIFNSTKRNLKIFAPWIEMCCLHTLTTKISQNQKSSSAIERSH